MINNNLTAKDFIKKLESSKSALELKKYERYFPVEKRNGDKFIGVRMGKVFETAKEFIGMPLEEIEKLMESDIHEIRAGAMSIMSKTASDKKTTPAELKGLYDLYIKRHDRINNWDLVDLASYYVVGKYLEDKPRDILYKLAKSKDLWERRTAIVATAHFIRKGETEDTFKIAEILVNDKEDFVHKGVGWMLRAAGGEGLIKFLDKNAGEMPRTMLRYAVENLDKKKREYYLNKD